MSTLDQVAGARRLYSTRSLCPVCELVLPAEVVEREGRVWVSRVCPEHGQLEGLVCSDLAWWNSLPEFHVEPSKPAVHQTESVRGCPEDCGLCPAHRQLAGTAAIELSNHCNAACPSCLAENAGTFELSAADVSAEVDRLIAAQGHVDALTLSGGEPTLHPELFAILASLDRPEIGRIVLNTNGIRIARDDAFVARLATCRNVYVSLHFDGDGAPALRGTSRALQEQALERLVRHGVAVVPLVLAAQGVNQHELGPLVASLLSRSEAIKSVMLSMMTYAGQGGRSFPAEQATRLTIPGALDQLEASSGGALARRDFMPLPMPNPMCAAIGYYLVLDGELTPLVPIAPRAALLEFMRTGHFGHVDGGLEGLLRTTIDDLYANPDRYADPERLRARFKRLLGQAFPADAANSDGERKARGESLIKSVYLMQFMDAWTFDAKRLSRCSCQHLLPDGRRVPSCGYYSYHRRLDPRYAGAVDGFF